MNFKIYTGEVARNCSVNITCHGSFDAENTTEALRKINVNIKHRYCKKWQFPTVQDSKTGEWLYPDYIENFHDNIRFNPFVCVGDPFERNVVWKSSEACISFFQKT